MMAWHGPDIENNNSLAIFNSEILRKVQVMPLCNKERDVFELNLLYSGQIHGRWVDTVCSSFGRILRGKYWL